MKKLFYIIICLMFTLVGCTKKEDNIVNSNKPNHQLYYIESDYQKGTSSIININMATGKEEVLLNTTEGISMLQYNNNKIYALFTNRVGYVDNGKIKYITSEDEYVSRFGVHNGIVYYGKNNNNASDDIFERFAMKDVSGKNEKIINDVGISQLLVDNYIYYKPDSGSDVMKLLRYDLDSTNKVELYDKSIGQLTKFGDYLYFIDYTDNSSLYRMKYDGTDIKRMVQGPLKLSNANVNQINGYTNMGVIDNYLYYINTNDGNKIYRTDGNNSEIVMNAAVTSIYVKDSYIYCNYNDYKKSGVYLLDKTGKEIQRITNTDVLEYIVN